MANGISPFSCVVLCLSVLTSQGVFGRSLAGNPSSDARTKRDMSAIITGLVSSFFNKGGQKGVDELNNSQDQQSVLMKYLGPAVMAALIGGGGNDLISGILRSFTGGSSGSSNTGSSNSGTSFISPNSPGGSSSGSRTSSSSVGNSGTNNFQPLPGSNTKTGVAIINSSPNDRKSPPASSSGSGVDTDYSDPLLPTSSGRGTGGVSKNRNPGLTRDNSQSDIFSGTRGGSGRRPATPTSDNDY